METEHPSAKSPKYSVSWGEYFQLTDKLIATILQKVGFKYTYIHGIPRGGLVLAVILSHRLNLKFLETNMELSKLALTEKVLVVDDLVDTGKTLETFSSHFDTAVLFKKPWSTVQPIYYVAETTKWVIFPYEKNIGA